ncbi:MAG: hypothetical protein COB23_02550 [Methylophaga sp.]|nr:MAG: hypothetical protein COB23_02550 [Methylophaga sp.]
MILLLIVAAILILIATVTCIHLYKLNQCQAKGITSLQNQLSALCAGAVGSDDRIRKFEQTLHLLKEQQNTMSLGTNAQHSYDHAIRLARKGAGVDQLIDNCNLSNEEAHLINRLHSRQPSSMQTDLH